MRQPECAQGAGMRREAPSDGQRQRAPERTLVSALLSLRSCVLAREAVGWEAAGAPRAGWCRSLGQLWAEVNPLTGQETFCSQHSLRTRSVT